MRISFDNRRRRDAQVQQPTRLSRIRQLPMPQTTPTKWWWWPATWRLVSDACPAPPDGRAGYYPVTVMVTERGRGQARSPWPPTTTEQHRGFASEHVPPGTPIMQYLVGATLTATADRWRHNQCYPDALRRTVAGEVTGVTWRWFRGGTEIDRRGRAGQYLHPSPDHRCGPARFARWL